MKKHGTKTYSAVALEYGKSDAPTVISKGEGDLAAEIVERALDLDIPIIEDAMLQRLLMEIPLEEEIPESLYRSVAVVLSWAFWLRGDPPPERN